MKRVFWLLMACKELIKHGRTDYNLKGLLVGVDSRQERLEFQQLKANHRKI